MNRKMLIAMLIAVAVAVFGVAGCAVNTVDRSAFDEYYRSVGNGTTFSVNYATFKPVWDGLKTVDTTPVLVALKEVYGEKISFVTDHPEHSVVVKEVKIVKPWGFKLKSTVTATLLPENKEIAGEFWYAEPWMNAKGVTHMYTGAALDLAKQIKAITDAEGLGQK